MNVKDILVLALNFCHEEELSSLLKENEVLSDEEGKRVAYFVDLVNLVHEEISSEHLPYVKTITLQTDEGRVDFSSFKDRVLDVIEVRNSHGRKIKFRMFENHLFALANEVTITYKTLPSKLLLSSEFASRLPERIYAYGVARNYFYLSGVTDEGEIYDNRFKDSILVILGKSKEVKIPARRWI